jgi:DNA polymerase III gamma/tau subunit
VEVTSGRYPPLVKSREGVYIMGVLEHYLWTEKYRPKTLEDMSIEDKHYSALKRYIKDGNIQHLLLYGPPGSGKTTIAQILLDKLNAQKLVLNASSKDRGIGTIKGKVTMFASSMSLADSLKVVFLDEGDSITPDAQRALRNTMETYARTCRFIITANYVDRIIPAIQSRCVKMEFQSYPKDDVFALIVDILEKESIKFSDDDVDFLIEKFYPDVRSIINNAQLCCIGNSLDSSMVSSLEFDVDNFRSNLLSGDVRKLREGWRDVSDFTKFYKFLFDDFLFNVEGDSEKKAAVAIIIGEYLFRDTSVVNREINFSSCVIEVLAELGIKLKF